MRELYEKCADLIMDRLPEIQARRFNVEYKDDGSPVTEADRYLENLIKTWLHSELGEFHFVGEESYDFQRVDAGGYYVLLDPIDGTENFCSGLKEWGVSIGIWKNRVHQGSMILMPELGERLISGDPPALLSSRITGFSSSFHEKIASGMREADEYRVTGCAVYNLYNVIRGSFARFVNPKGAYAWDLLPGVMLALEHKCEVLLDGEIYDGRFLEPARKYCVDIRHRYDIHRGQGPEY